MAFEILGKQPKISYVPLWVRDLALSLVRLFGNEKTYGPLEFFMKVMTMDMIAPQYGIHDLYDYFKKTVKNYETK
jgi:hypothetical protein